MQLEVVMKDKESVWLAMIEKHGLLDTPYKDVSSWGFGDFVFSWDYDFFADGSKARRFGFHDYVDTEKMFLDILGNFKESRIIP